VLVQSHSTPDLLSSSPPHVRSRQNEAYFGCAQEGGAGVRAAAAGDAVAGRSGGSCAGLNSRSHPCEGAGRRIAGERSHHESLPAHAQGDACCFPTAAAAAAAAAAARGDGAGPVRGASGLGHVPLGTGYVAGGGLNFSADDALLLAHLRAGVSGSEGDGGARSSREEAGGAEAGGEQDLQEGDVLGVRGTEEERLYLRDAADGNDSGGALSVGYVSSVGAAGNPPSLLPSLPPSLPGGLARSAMPRSTSLPSLEAEGLDE